VKLTPLRSPQRPMREPLSAKEIRTTGSTPIPTWRSTGGRGGQGSQSVERSGGVAAGLGAVHHHVVSTGIRSVEPMPVKIKVAD